MTKKNNLIQSVGMRENLLRFSLYLCCKEVKEERK